jgi:hypothetical protein
MTKGGACGAAGRWSAWLVFGVAMGLLEAIVVVYLRALFYPDGFAFPMAGMPAAIYGAELLREACTIAMLFGLAWLVGRTGLQRFAVFLASFAVWDIVYYAGLKLLLDWPDSLWTWDVLFLIPVPWFGPVLAPLLYCTAMLAVAAAVWRLDAAGRSTGALPWLLMAASVGLVLAAFMADAFRLLTEATGSVSDPLQRRAVVEAAFAAFTPVRFGWGLFLAGLACGYASAGALVVRAGAGAPR